MADISEQKLGIQNAIDTCIKLRNDAQSLDNEACIAKYAYLFEYTETFPNPSKDDVLYVLDRAISSYRIGLAMMRL